MMALLTGVCREESTLVLTITTTHSPATDLGYLLHKNPARSQEFELSFGKAHVFYPEAGDAEGASRPVREFQIRGATMKWVTRSHVHVDRVACPWLIKRFVDSEAEILFVPKSRVDEVAEMEGAIPFDAPGVELGHHDGKCSFETIIEKYELKDAALLRLAKIVHSGDVRDTDSDPLAAGFEAIAVGYSIRFPNDKENLAHQFEMYDALYAWCRLDVARSAK